MPEIPKWTIQIQNHSVEIFIHSSVKIFNLNLLCLLIHLDNPIKVFASKSIYDFILITPYTHSAVRSLKKMPKM